MATLNQHVYTIIHLADRGPEIRVHNFSKRDIEHWIHTERAFLITKTVEKGRTVPANFIQDLGCWPLTCVDEADCAKWEWGNSVKKAVFPAVMEIDRNAGLSFFGLIDKKTRIYIPDSNYGSLDEYLQFKPKREGQMIGAETVYLWRGCEKLKTVNIQGLFKDPTLVTYYSENGIATCYDKDSSEYPIPADEVTYLYQLVLDKYIFKSIQLPKQEKNEEKTEAAV